MKKWDVQYVFLLLKYRYGFIHLWCSMFESSVESNCYRNWFMPDREMIKATVMHFPLYDLDLGFIHDRKKLLHACCTVCVLNVQYASLFHLYSRASCAFL